MITICVANRKGGVSKTTTAVNVASILGEMDFKVLLIDLDPQANATENFGINPSELNFTAYNVLTGDKDIKDVIIKTDFKVDIIGSNNNLSNAEIALYSEFNRDSILSVALNEANLDYDFIILDLPPELSILSINGIVASDEVIIPIDIGKFSLSGISELTSLINLIKKAKLNDHVSVMGILLTKVDNRTSLSKKRRDELISTLGDKVFKTEIKQNITLADSQDHNKPINYFSKDCSGYVEYKSLVEEVLENVKG